MDRPKYSGSKPKAHKSRKGDIPADLELDPDAWPKFEKLVKSAAKMGPKPHQKKI